LPELIQRALIFGVNSLFTFLFGNHCGFVVACHEDKYRPSTWCLSVGKVFAVREKDHNGEDIYGSIAQFCC
ncbi:hypothetical protein C8J56DRAFT_1161875, partial [Mycena floridula]